MKTFPSDHLTSLLVKVQWTNFFWYPKRNIQMTTNWRTSRNISKCLGSRLRSLGQSQYLLFSWNFFIANRMRHCNILALSMKHAYVLSSFWIHERSWCSNTLQLNLLLYKSGGYWKPNFWCTINNLNFTQTLYYLSVETYITNDSK